MVFSILAWASAPLAALGLYGMSFVWALLLVRSFVFYAGTFAVLSRTGLPTFIAALAWRENSCGIKLKSWSALYWPVSASLLFFAKIGISYDLLYAGYWLLIPVAVVLLPSHFLASRWMRAVVSSLSAHSVGSLILLYAGLKVSWVSLIPVVMVERLISIGGIGLISKLWDMMTNSSSSSSPV